MLKRAIGTCGTVAIIFTIALRSAQAQDCKKLSGSTHQELTAYLETAVPSANNAQCIWFAIDEFERHPFEPAIPALIKLLDFRRPDTKEEAFGLALRTDYYPAMEALGALGKKPMASVLKALEAGPTSEKARENAVEMWMIWFYREDNPSGIAALRDETTRLRDSEVKQRLNWAISKALKMCEPAAKCELAASGRVPHVRP